MGFQYTPPKTVTVFESASRLTAADSGDIRNMGYRGLVLVIDITGFTGGTNVTFTVQGKDPVSGKYYTLLASAALTATGTTVLEIRPDITTVTANLTAAKQLPSQFKVIATVTGTFTVLTYSVGATLCP